MKKNKILFVSLLTLAALVSCGGTTSSTSNNNSTNSSVNSSTSSEVSTSNESSSDTSINKETPIAEGDDQEAIKNPGKMYYKASEGTTVKTATNNDGTYTVEYENATSFELFFESADEFERNEITFNLDSSVAVMPIVINGTTYELARGNNTFSVRSDDTADTVSLHIEFGTSEQTIAKAKFVITNLSITEVQYNTLTPVVDGSVDEWAGTKNEEKSLSIAGSTETTTNKSIRFMASLKDDGLYVAAEAYHGVFISESTEWWNATNLEVFIGDNNAQYWATANESKKHTAEGLKQAVFTEEVTDKGENVKHHTIIELFIPVNLFQDQIFKGELRVGVAWKTIGDKINNGEAAGGGEDEYWVPKGTWPNNADKAYCTESGLSTETSIVIDPVETSLTLDGDLSDWAELEALKHPLTLQGVEQYAHKSVKFYGTFIEGEGLYVAAEVHHEKYVNSSDVWHTNSNMEFFVGGNQYYVTANEALGNQCDAGAMKTVEDGEYYYTVVEAFVSKDRFVDGATSANVGFAWKTPGDIITGGAANEGGEDEYWVPAGGMPSTYQYTVTKDGIQSK